jgi:hypothetical protein
MEKRVREREGDRRNAGSYKRKREGERDISRKESNKNRKHRRRKMYDARAPRLFMLTTPVCFCPVLASTREKACLLLREQNNIMGRE